MTTAELCGYRWRRGGWCEHWRRTRHRCRRNIDHPAPCRCRCGATTTRPEGE